MNNAFEFEVVTSKVCLSDPCYTKDTWCGEYDIPALNGKWKAEVVRRDNRIAEFRAFHVNHSAAKMFESSTDFGVDSGQFGIFDSSIYDPETDFEDKDKFYGAVCELTLSKEQCGVIFDKGFVSSSGYGDGGYVGWAAYEHGNLVSFSIEFISEAEFSDDD